MNFKLITKNYLECSTDENILDAVDFRDAILKFFFVEGVERDNDDVTAVVGEFIQKTDTTIWISDNNEELYFEIHQM